MDRLREEFLARAAFAEDEHRGVARAMVLADR